jgi:phosphoglycolate phosphatase
MKNYEVIAFDLDGTLTDPEKGLIEGFIYAFKKMGVTDYGDRDSLRRFIGPSLYVVWQDEFGFNENTVTLAIDKFREYYNIYGWWDNKVYEGIHEMLAKLKEEGKTIILATSKPEDTAKRVLNLFDLTKYFDFIGGALRSTERDKKSDVINYVLYSLGVSDKYEVVLVGDRKFDAEGAALVGIDSVGVLWGHGSVEELDSAGFITVINDPSELLELFK